MGILLQLPTIDTLIDTGLEELEAAVESVAAEQNRLSRTAVKSAELLLEDLIALKYL